MARKTEGGLRMVKYNSTPRVNAVVEHLFRCSGVTVIAARVVTIGKSTYLAVEYEQERVAPEGCRNPGSYTTTGMYLIGNLPKAYKHNPGSVSTDGIRFEIDGRLWYVAGYSPETIKKEYRSGYVRDPFDGGRPMPFVLLALDDTPSDGKVMKCGAIQL